jgi:transcriptional regulator with XRE-family HTH domain
MLHGFYISGSLLGMSENQPETTPGNLRDTALARWLDSVIPALYKSDAALARAIGVDRSLVGKWRRGATPQPRALVRLADATGTSVEALSRIAGYRSAGSGS